MLGEFPKAAIDTLRCSISGSCRPRTGREKSWEVDGIVDGIVDGNGSSPPGRLIDGCLEPDVVTGS